MQFGSQKRSFADAFYLFLCGICMGAADLVPGISGGTIAFIMGFYQPLLESIKTLNVSAFKLLISFKFRAFSEQVAWKFLLQLLLGIGVAFCTLASLFHFILGHEVYRVYFYALFMGLITASFVFCLRQISRWTLTSLLALLIGIVSAYCLTGTISFLNKNQQLLWFEMLM
jgi:putative membrane protein